MTYEELIEKIATAYDTDGFPEEGDTLALFIRQELKDAVDGEYVNLEEAALMMDRAISQLEAVRYRIEMLR